MTRREPYRDDLPTAGLKRDASDGALVLRILGDEIADHHPLPTRGEVTLGRGGKADISIGDETVSRRHAAIAVGPSLTITDLGSSHGTRVRGRKLEPGRPHPLQLGEPIELGSVVAVVHKTVVAQAPAPGRARSPVVADQAMRELHELVDRFAKGDISVLLLGETGVGKEITAEAIHAGSPRSKMPLLRLNCAAFSESLLESELFGHERGAFTGAIAAKPGVFETAQGGTVFLDEVGELPLATQVKLLRLLEERRVTRVGATKSIAIDVRFVSATNRDLEAEITRGSFRQDLYFRLAAATLYIPPLRERSSEIEPLALRFGAEFAARAQLPPPTLQPATTRLLLGYAWPGNIRELRNFMERAVLLSGGEPLEPSHFPQERMHASGAPSVSSRAPTVEGGGGDALWSEVEAIERQRILDALQACGGNQSRAAKMLGIARNTLGARIAAYGLPRPRKR